MQVEMLSGWTYSNEETQLCYHSKPRWQTYQPAHRIIVNSYLLVVNCSTCLSINIHPEIHRINKDAEILHYLIK